MISYMIVQKNSRSELGSSVSLLPTRASISSGCILRRLAMPGLISSFVLLSVSVLISMFQNPIFSSFISKLLISFMLSPGGSVLRTRACWLRALCLKICSMDQRPLSSTERTLAGSSLNIFARPVTLYPASHTPRMIVCESRNEAASGRCPTSGSSRCSDACIGREIEESTTACEVCGETGEKVRAKGPRSRLSAMSVGACSSRLTSRTRVASKLLVWLRNRRRREQQT
mmetsp:Transcript_27907/g.90667  ORF Transcript_27907/g.90667 Transcript_27907/m.90667 type:complete len:229 (-) Transcript_27907:1438-2124(-)